MKNLKIKGYTLILDDYAYKLVKDRKLGIYGSTHRKPYVRVSIEGKWIPLHRLLCNPKNGLVDHINGNQFDNRLKNLRVVNPNLNRFNAAKPTRIGKPMSSKYKGVHRKSQTRNWSAEICFKGERFNLGTHKTEKEAALAYDKKAKQLFKGFAVLNFKQ